jgi:NTE family protein
MAHIGVIDYLRHKGIPVDLIAGSSIGALIGALYCAGSLDIFRQDIVNMGRREMLGFFDPVFPRSGLIAGRDSMRLIAKYIPADTRIEDLALPLAVLATDYNTGRAVVFRSGSVHEALRASISIPGVFTPVRFRGTHLIDGGVANPLPVNVIRWMGAGLTVAVNLHPSIDRRSWKKAVRRGAGSERIAVDSRDIEIPVDRKSAGLTARSGGDKSSGWLRTIEHWIMPERTRAIVTPPTYSK